MEFLKKLKIKLYLAEYGHSFQGKKRVSVPHSGVEFGMKA